MISPVHDPVNLIFNDIRYEHLLFHCAIDVLVRRGLEFYDIASLLKCFQSTVKILSRIEFLDPFGAPVIIIAIGYSKDISDIISGYGVLAVVLFVFLYNEEYLLKNILVPFPHFQDQ